MHNNIAPSEFISTGCVLAERVYIESNRMCVVLPRFLEPPCGEFVTIHVLIEEPTRYKIRYDVNAIELPRPLGLKSGEQGSPLLVKFWSLKASPWKKEFEFDSVHLDEIDHGGGEFIPVQLIAGVASCISFNAMTCVLPSTHPIQVGDRITTKDAAWNLSNPTVVLSVTTTTITMACTAPDTAKNGSPVITLWKKRSTDHELLERVAKKLEVDDATLWRKPKAKLRDIWTEAESVFGCAPPLDPPYYIVQRSPSPGEISNAPHVASAPPLDVNAARIVFEELSKNLGKDGWHHLAVDYDNRKSEVEIWVNGKLMPKGETGAGIAEMKCLHRDKPEATVGFQDQWGEEFEIW